MARIQLPANGWQPRGYQLDAWEYLEGGGKRCDLVWHRRSGKDELSLHWTAVSAIQKAATYWYMLPQKEQARKAIWTAVNPHTGIRRIDEAFPFEIRDKTLDDEMFIRFKNGSTWQVLGSDHYNSHVGSPPYGVVFSEWPLSNPAAWGYLMPILIENGGWALFNGTPRGKNHGFNLLQSALHTPGWFGQVLRASETGVMSAQALAEARQAYIDLYGADMGEALYQQEYECSFEAAIIGAYWGAEMALAEREGRIASLSVDPALPVHTAWDLGVGQNLAIWFWQTTAGRVALVDFYQSNSGSIEDAAAAIIAKGYRRGDDWVPHDARARDIGTGRTRVETMIRAGLKPRLVPDCTVDDRINAARLTIARSHFNAEKCADGIEALKAFRREWDEKLRTFRDKPVHDWSSHPSDAYSYLAMAWREMGGTANDNRTPGKLLGVGHHNQVSLDDLWDMKPRRRARY